MFLIICLHVYRMGVPIRQVLFSSVLCAYMGIVRPSSTSIKNHTRILGAESREAFKAHAPLYGKHTLLKESANTARVCSSVACVHWLIAPLSLQITSFWNHDQCCIKKLCYYLKVGAVLIVFLSDLFFELEILLSMRFGHNKHLKEDTILDFREAIIDNVQTWTVNQRKYSCFLKEFTHNALSFSGNINI